MTPVFIVVSGGRHYLDYGHVARVLNEERTAGMVIVQGECPSRSQGADGLAKKWCRENGVPCIGIEAPWAFYGLKAGPIRNGWMYDLLQVYKLVAFPGGNGTDNAVEQARAREIPVRDERKRASAMSAFGQDPKGLEAQPASAAPEGGDAHNPEDKS